MRRYSRALIAASGVLVCVALAVPAGAQGTPGGTPAPRTDAPPQCKRDQDKCKIVISVTSYGAFKTQESSDGNRITTIFNARNGSVQSDNDGSITGLKKVGDDQIGHTITITHVAGQFAIGEDTSGVAIVGSALGDAEVTVRPATEQVPEMALVDGTKYADCTKGTGNNPVDCTVIIESDSYGALRVRKHSAEEKITIIDNATNGKITIKTGGAGGSKIDSSNYALIDKISIVHPDKPSEIDLAPVGDSKIKITVTVKKGGGVSRVMLGGAVQQAGRQEEKPPPSEQEAAKIVVEHARYGQIWTGTDKDGGLRILSPDGGRFVTEGGKLVFKGPRRRERTVGRPTWCDATGYMKRECQFDVQKRCKKKEGAAADVTVEQEKDCPTTHDFVGYAYNPSPSGFCFVKVSPLKMCGGFDPYPGAEHGVFVTYRCKGGKEDQYAWAFDGQEVYLDCLREEASQ
jgi:hypothetical protein